MTETDRPRRSAVPLLLLVLIAGCADAVPTRYIRLEGSAPPIAAAPAASLLVSFWATWCPPCRKETAELLGLAGNPPADLRVLVISQDADMETVERFLGGRADPRLHLRLDTDRVLSDAFGVRTLPASVLVVDGRLVARFEGARDWASADVRALIDRLIAEARKSSRPVHSAQNAVRASIAAERAGK